MVKRITLVGTLPPIKGVSDYCIQQTEELAKTMDVEFYNFKSIYPEFLYPGKTKEKDPVFSVPKSPRLKVYETLAWYNPLSWIGAGVGAKGEIVQFHWWTFFLFPVFFTIANIAKLRGKKVVCTVHNVVGHESGFWDRFFCGLIFSIPDCLIVHTRANKKQLQEIFGVKENRIAVIAHGIYTFYRDAEVSQKDSRKKIGIPLNAKTLLFFGNIRPYKGVEDLIDAFKLAKPNVPDLFLVVAGKPWNAEYQKEIESRLAGTTACKLFFDYVPSSDIKYYFFGCDAMVLPYKHFEAQSGPGNIALAFEKPLLVANTGGLPELVRNPGCVFESGDVPALAKKIEWVFGSATVLQQLQADAQKQSQEFSWPVLVEKTILLYKKLLQED